MAKRPTDGTATRHRVIAAKMGWGRLPEIDLATAYVIEVLRAKGALSVVNIHQEVELLAKRQRTPVFDQRCWEIRLRLEDLESNGLVSVNEFDIWRVTEKAILIFGDSRLKPIYNSRSVRDLHEYRLIQGGVGDTTPDD